MRKRKRFFVALILLLVSVLGILTFTGVHFPNTSPASLSPSAQSSPNYEARMVIAHNLAPIASNQWYSNIYSQFPTQPLFTLPAAFRLSPQGVGISLPQVTHTAQSIAAPYIMDLQLGFPDALQKPTFTSIGDWSVGLSMSTNQSEQLQFTLAHGVPFTVFHITGSQILLTCADSCTPYLDNTTAFPANGQVTTQALSLVIRGHTYVLVLDAASPVQFTGRVLTISGARRIFLGIPDSREHYTLFKNIASSEILNTTAS